MAFYLISRGSDDELRLLSAAPMESRADAMAALSRLTADPAFDRWDDEVFVADLGVAVPVLLVRPAAAAQAPAVAQPDDEEQAETADAWLADLPEEPVAQATEVPEQDAETAFDSDTSDMPDVAAFVVAASDPAIADEIVAEAEESEAGVEDDSDGLRAALQRTAVQMSAEGIVPPDSAGLADEEEPVLEDEVDSQDEVATAQAAPIVEDETELEEVATEPSAGEDDGFVVPQESRPARSWPWAVKDDESSATGPAVAPDIAYVFDALEEPDSEVDAEQAAPEALADDAPAVELVEPVEPLGVAGVEAPVVTEESPGSALADSPEDAPRAVILGAYDDDSPSMERDDLIGGVPEATEPMGAFVAAVEAAHTDLAAAPSEPALDTDFIAAPAVPALDTDFILDLDEIEPALDDAASVPVSEAPEAEVVAVEPLAEPIAPAALTQSQAEAEQRASGFSATLQEYTCDDCVYEQTCPNKDQRLPKDCGSFQWR